MPKKSLLSKRQGVFPERDSRLPVPALLTPEIRVTEYMVDITKPAAKPAAQPSAAKGAAPAAPKPVSKPGMAPPKANPRLGEAQVWAKNKGREFRGIIRLVGRDLQGELALLEALPRIRGIGANLSASLVRALVSKGVDPVTPVGALNEQEIATVEDVIRNPNKHGIPAFLLNRQKDPDTGLDRHLLAADLTFAVRGDVEREKMIVSYRGWRHGIGQKTRGQHTRSTGRSGMTVGVLKKAVKAQKAAAATGAQEKSAPAAKK